MEWTLTLCFGMFLGVCGQLQTFDFKSLEDCERERAQQVKRIGEGYAVCAPRQPVKGARQ